MRVIVTGAAGFLGAATCDALTAHGHDVVAGWHRAHGPEDRQWVHLDVTRADELAAACEGADAVVHTAYTRDAAMHEVIVGGTAAVAAVARAAGTVLVHVSSDVVFAGEHRPYHEHDRPDPVAGFAYGEAKALAEDAVRDRPGSTVVRTSLLWGGPARPGPLDDSVCAAASTGSQMVQFTDELRRPVHVEDVAAGIAALLATPGTDRPAVAHLVGPELLDRLSIARRLAPELGVDPDALRPGLSADHPDPRPRELDLRCGVTAAAIAWRPRPLPRL